MRRVSVVICVVVSLGWVATAFSQGSRVEDVTVDSWVYDALLDLSVHGHLPGLLLHTRPLSRGEVADAIRVYRPDTSAGIIMTLSRLRAEFREELAADDPIHGDHRARLGGGPTARVDQFRHGFAKNRYGFDAIGAFTITNSVAARWRVRFDSDGRYDTQFHGEYWREHFTAWVEQAVAVAHRKHLTVAFGREYWRWGPSPHDALLLSDHSPPFDGLRATYRASRWSYAFHAAMLDRMSIVASDYANGSGPEGVANRYLVAHRLNWRIRDNLEVAASEVMLYGGFDRPWQWNYLNPLVPYYWEQLNNSTNDNPLWSLEASWRARDGLLFYGEWLIDDFQIDFHSEPQQIGVLLGGFWSPARLGDRLVVNAEYQRINTFVYGQVRPWNRYVHERDIEGEVIGIGSNLGTDGDRITALPLYHWNKHLDLFMRVDYIRRGDNSISDPQESGVPKGIPFPSGVVEKEARFGTGAQCNYGGRIVARTLIGYYRATNVGNVRDLDAEGFFFQFKLNVLWWKTLGV